MKEKNYILFSFNKNKGGIILKIFIAELKAIKELDENISKKLENICAKNYEVLIGDADGIHSSVQNFYN